jgi:phosphatidylserine/phosphatidylglycerophosphate/cardiolipin synthase-like enzyme
VGGRDYVITGSFNFTKAAGENNAENLLIIHDSLEMKKKRGSNTPE